MGRERETVPFGETRGKRQEDVTKGPPGVRARKIRESSSITRVIMQLTEA